jgi:hypothetical protein
MIIPDIERYRINDIIVNVVREDMVSAFPGPNNAKVRGIESKIIKLKEQGIKSVASQDTRISRIGWGISWLCKKYDLKHYNYYPMATQDKLPFYQQMSQYWGGKPIPLHGTFSSAFRSLCEQHMKKNDINAYFFPIGASLDETLIELSSLVSQLPSDIFEGTIVTNVSSGTICAGLTYGCEQNNLKTDIVGVLGSSFENRHEKILKKIHTVTNKKCDYPNLKITNPGYEYTQPEYYIPPFPCDLYLDRKAWKWLVDNIDTLKQPITFWNIGGEWNPMDGLDQKVKGDGMATRSDVYKCIKTVGELNDKN